MTCIDGKPCRQEANGHNRCPDLCSMRIGNLTFVGKHATWEGKRYRLAPDGLREVPADTLIDTRSPQTGAVR